MSSGARFFVVNNIKLPINASLEEAFLIAKARLGKLKIATTDLDFKLYKRSIDARDKKDIRFVYSVSCYGELPRLSDAALASASISSYESVSIGNIKRGDTPLASRPVIVGSGPAGLFAALILAENGYRPLILERGGSVSERKKAVERLNIEHVLDKNTNIQFGAGGAGTFSDGKLVTRVNDPISQYVFERFVEFGAPSEITYMARPHVGTDVLSVVVDRILDRIVELGGEIMYHTEFISVKGNNLISTNVGDIPFGALILAIGHSARDTYTQLIRDNFLIVPKGFSVGMRIEHKAVDIDKALYGSFAGHPVLGHAEYNLSYNTKVRGVYTFCMCPGGEVVAATSEDHGVVVNGMSHHARNGENSNSAVVCSIFKDDYGATAERAIEFQRSIERAAFLAGGGEYSAPIITVGDFLSDKCKTEPSRVMPSYMSGTNVKLASAGEYLPGFVCDSIKNAILNFDKKINGFAKSDAVLTGAETRTSAPVRIIRDNLTRLADGQDNVYPVGEGAGYAGGITSAAIDGIKTAISVINRYSSGSDG